MPGGWWSEHVCNCISHVVTYNAAHFWHRTFIWITFSLTVRQHWQSALFFKLSMTLTNFIFSSSPISISFSPLRQERWSHVTDRCCIKVKKLDLIVHSIIHLTSPNIISINSVKTHFYLVRNTSFNKIRHVFAPSEQHYQRFTAWNPLCRKQGQRVCFYL